MKLTLEIKKKLRSDITCTVFTQLPGSLTIKSVHVQWFI